MLVILPVSQNDFKEPINVFKFIKVLRHFGPYSNHELLVVGRPSAVNYVNSIFDLTKDLFKKSNVFLFETDGPTGWPEGPNFYWKNTIEYLKEINNKLPWFWMELDVLPLKSKWADLLEKEYKKNNMPCMGILQDTTTVTKSQVVIPIAKHLQGTAIYPPNLHELSNIWSYVDELSIAFDVVTQWELVPLTAETKLIQQGFRTKNYKILNNPFRIQGEDNGDLQGMISYNDPLDPKAVVHHGCKDTSLADIITSPDYNHWQEHASNANA